MPNTPDHYQPITQIASRLKSGDMTASALTRQILDRIDQLDGDLKAYVTVMADHAVAAAERADREIASGSYRGPLHGVPIAVKDLCFTRGVTTMGGSHALSDHVPTFDGTVVTRLEAAGAVLLGKLNLTEGAMGGYNPRFEIPKNPWNPERWAGLHRADPARPQQPDSVSDRWAATREARFDSLRRLAVPLASNRLGDASADTASWPWQILWITWDR